MTFDYAVLGRKLKDARESLLITPQQAASRLQIGLQEYLDIELGRNRVTGDQLVLLALLYRRDFRYFVTGDYPSAESQVQEIFRRNAALSQSDRIAIQEFERGHPNSFAYYSNLVGSGEISRFPLEIEDLVEMSTVAQSKRASDAELSCFVVAKRIGGKAMTDDARAIKYIQRYIQMPPGSVIQLVEILIEAYLENYLGDHELRSIQQKLADNQFAIKIDLANEAAKRRWMTEGYNRLV